MLTKEQANKIKKVIKKEAGNYTVYFNSKTGELRITVAQWQDGVEYGASFNPDELEKKNILKILDALTKNEMRPSYRKDFKKYQGFINCRYIVFF